MAKPDTSILIVSVGDSVDLRKVLSRVRSQASALNAEIVLVLNCEAEQVSQHSRETLEQYCDCLAFESMLGKSHGLNSGVALCRGDVIAFTDDDTEPAEHWLQNITAPLLATNRDLKLVATGGPVTPIYAKEVPRWFRELVASKPNHFLGPRHEWGDEPFNYGPKRGVLLFGANMAVRREVFKQFGYDTELGPNRLTGLQGGEDALFSQRLLNAGFRICHVPEASVYHPVRPERATTGFVEQASYAQGRQSVIMCHKLGLPVRRPYSIRNKLARDWILLSLAWLRGNESYRLARFRLQRHRGMLDEVRRSR